MVVMISADGWVSAHAENSPAHLG